ncbi:CRISPR-associated helicase Cas3' [Tepidibacillus marianensis]|uniref:CRISPR-associated helicase Cas3' n=1 Tax=Tepidibacillus marianensis TaxID=3131995 RepID=UPI0030D3ECC6
MSLLIPFSDCIARPNDKEDELFLLSDHLVHVKNFMENWNMSLDYSVRKLMGMAGICHDIGKAHKDWQAYILNPSIKKGPTHAATGAFLFSYIAYRWLELSKDWEKFNLYWIWLIRDIADHHTDLKDLLNDEWIKSIEWEKFDLNGIEKFINKQYPKLNNMVLSKKVLIDWMEELDELLEEASEKVDLGYSQKNCQEMMLSIQTWKDITTSMIAGDRFDVKETISLEFNKEILRESDQSIDQFCNLSSQHPLSKTRIEAQKDILAQLKNSSSSRFYTLQMPTGYGKTITSLKMATWLGLKQNYKKIIYVAPYLSILEQTSKVIEESMKIGVLEHHSLAILSNDYSVEENKEFFPNNYLSMEVWANSIVCTSFQQWAKAIFPKRAQDVLRRAFLRDSVIIIDEPQIFNPEGWNTFLCGLEAIGSLYNLRVIFLSATMPPFKYGLKEEPKKLFFLPSNKMERYKVVLEEKMDEQILANFIRQRKEEKQAVILNTIEDAFRLYIELKKFNETDNIQLLHGLMIPLHKTTKISKLQYRLLRKETPLIVVSTQIIEAGVDVSFNHVARALPILPSIVQAAGRVNRHLENNHGILSIIPFYRGGLKNTRNSIYDKRLQEITDFLLYKKKVWGESEMVKLVNNYYNEMFRQNTYETGKEAIRSAYEGNWSLLSTFHPFGSDFLKLPIFIPWNYEETDIKWLPKRFIFLQKK